MLKSSGASTSPRPAEKKSAPVELPVLAEIPAAQSAPSAKPNLEDAAAVLELSKTLMEQGKEDQALALLAGYGGSDLRVPQALGEAYVSTGRLKDAERVFMDLSLRQPSESYHRYNLGLVEYRMGKIDMAEIAYQKAVDLDPNFADARYNLGLLYIRNRDYPKALSQLEEAVRLREDADYYINYGVALRELNRFPASQAALEKAVSIAPGNILAMNNLGITHYTAGNLPEARRVFDEVLTSAPEDQTARTYLAKISAASEVAPLSTTDWPAEEKKTVPENAYADLPEMKVAAGATDGAGAAESVRLRKENRDLRRQIEDLEKQMDEMKRGVYKQMVQDEKAQSRRVDAALKKAQEKLERKERELADWTDEPRESAPQPYQNREVIDDRLNEIQRALAQARAEIEEVRRSQGPVNFSPEPGSTDERLDSADRAVQQMRRQIRQLTIERDMLRTEIDAMSSGGGAPGDRGSAPYPAKGTGRTNVNLADLSALLLIPGMEERLAHNILWYRQNIGPFKSVLDLKKVPGMDDLHHTQMLDFVSAGSETAQ